VSNKVDCKEFFKKDIYSIFIRKKQIVAHRRKIKVAEELSKTN
jgi:hypothetical protein